TTLPSPPADAAHSRPMLRRGVLRCGERRRWDGYERTLISALDDDEGIAPVPFLVSIHFEVRAQHQGSLVLGIDRVDAQAETDRSVDRGFPDCVRRAQA